MNTATATIMPQARVITLQELRTRKQPIPASWRRVAGMLKGRDTIDPVQYQKDIRAEWEQRLQKQIAIASSSHGH